MNIYTVRDNLKRTIQGKEELLATYTDPSLFACHRLVKEEMIQFLEVNIDELRRILADVEVCCEQHNEMSWALNPVGPLHPPAPENQSDEQSVLVMLSGPEPQRSVFAKRCSNVLSEMHEPFTILGTCNEIIDSEFATILGQVSVETSMQLQANHRRIICRSGYTTLMELHANKKKAVLVPTPHQAEQRYLADHWNKSFGYPTCAEKDLNKTHLDLLLKQL